MELPRYAQDYFKPYRYKVLKGGRGSAKSYSVARILLTRGAQSKRRVLCAREFQNSIKESVHRLLAEQIEAIGLQKHYKVHNDRITGKNGTEFLFKGVKMNVDSIKSMAGITDLWIEEAHTLSKRSWDVLVPTIREPNSEIWVTYNPENEDDPTHVKFCGPDGPPPNTLLRSANWRDNPWFPDVLKDEMEQLRQHNPELHAHVWEGETRSMSDAQVFKGKWEIREFEPPRHELSNEYLWDGPYFGNDWGFSVDPATLVKLFIDPVAMNIYIREAAGGTKIELDDLGQKMYGKVSESDRYIIRADKTRPETINYVNRQGWGINVVAAEQWPGSIEDGVDWLKSFNKIIIHPDCAEVSTEFRKYSYKIDRLSGDITRDIVDDYNHYIDAVRYALEPMIKAGSMGLLSVI